MRKKKLCFPIRLSAALIQFDVPEEYYIVIKLIFRMSLVQTVFFFLFFIRRLDFQRNTVGLYSNNIIIEISNIIDVTFLLGSISNRTAKYVFDFFRLKINYFKRVPCFNFKNKLKFLMVFFPPH